MPLTIDDTPYRLQHAADRLPERQVLVMQPDLVVALDFADRYQDLAWLERNGAAVFRDVPSSLEQPIGSIRRLGNIGAMTKRADQHAGALRKNANALRIGALSSRLPGDLKTACDDRRVAASAA